MRLIFIDEDIRYLRQLEAVLSKKSLGKHDFYMFSSVSQLRQLSIIDLGQSIILIHENQHEAFSGYLSHMPGMRKENIDVIVLVEGYANVSAAWPSIQKYQHVEQLLEDIRMTFLDMTRKEVRGRKKETVLFSVFHAGDSCSVGVKDWSCATGDRKMLILDFDPYSIGDDEKKERSSMSHLIGWIKKEKENVNLLLDETAHKKGKTHVLYGPLNMLDLESLSPGEIKRFVGILTEKLDYDAVVINMCHVHINALCAALLTASSDRLLIASDENLQLVVQRQFELKWRTKELLDDSVLEKMIDQKGEEDID